MKVNDTTRRAFAYRRMYRDLVLREGWEQVGASGGRLWELLRGSRWNHEIVDVRIAPGGKALFVKIEGASP